MSILIKGMEMPKEGSWKTVRIYPDGTCAVPNWQGDCTFIQGAQAVPVPKHRRLIDADAVERNLVKMQMAQKGVVGHGIRKSRAVVRDMATVIPASEAET